MRTIQNLLLALLVFVCFTANSQNKQEIHVQFQFDVTSTVTFFNQDVEVNYSSNSEGYYLLNENCTSIVVKNKNGVQVYNINSNINQNYRIHLFFDNKELKSKVIFD